MLEILPVPEMQLMNRGSELNGKILRVGHVSIKAKN